VVKTVQAGEVGHDDERRSASTVAAAEETLLVVRQVQADDAERGVRSRQGCEWTCDALDELLRALCHSLDRLRKVCGARGRSGGGSGSETREEEGRGAPSQPTLFARADECEGQRE